LRFCAPQSAGWPHQVRSVRQDCAQDGVWTAAVGRFRGHVATR
jgi:hypothetical protein